MKVSVFIIILFFFAFAQLSFGKCIDINKVYGQEWVQDFIEVPLDHTASNSKALKVSYYRHKSFDPKKETVIFFNGGPTIEGYSSLSSLGKNPHLSNVNMVFMDQRGTGCSSTFIDGKLNHFASDSIVQDAEILRQKILGDKKWSIFGQSFGGLISFRYIEMFPNSINTATIHGLALPDSGEEFLEKREFEIQKRAAELFEFSNNKEIKLSEIISELENNKYFIEACFDLPNTLAKKFCGPNMKTGLFMLMGFKSFWPIIYDSYERFLTLSKTNPEKLSEEVKKFSNKYLLRFKDELQFKALYTISYREIFLGHTYFSDHHSDHYMDELNDHEISELKYKHFFYPKQHLTDLELNPIDKKKIKNNLKQYPIKFGYFAGAYDTFIPLDLIIQTAKDLDVEKSLVIHPQSGHEGYDKEIDVLNHVNKSRPTNENCLELISLILH